jgi:hypothetical protein
MREGINVEVSAADREQLAAAAADRNSPQKHVWRAQIILATAESCGAAEIIRRAGVSKPCVWRWQEWFMREGAAGLRRDRTRKSGLPPLPSALVDRMVELTLAEPPGEATGPAGRSRRRAASRCARCSGSGRRTGCSRIECATASCRSTRLLPPSCGRGRALSRPARPQSGAVG